MTSVVLSTAQPTIVSFFGTRYMDTKTVPTHKTLLVYISLRPGHKNIMSIVLVMVQSTVIFSGRGKT